jgi:hypothetical protein
MSRLDWGRRESKVWVDQRELEIGVDDVIALRLDGIPMALAVDSINGEYMCVTSLTNGLKYRLSKEDCTKSRIISRG